VPASQSSLDSSANHASGAPSQSSDRPSPPYRVEGAGPLLVYIAGLDGTGELLFKQKMALARSYRVVTYRSREGGEFSYDDLTGDVAAIIEGNGERRATVVGESFGGTVALSFALRYPEMVERLVIVNSFPRYRGQLRIRLAARLASSLPYSLTYFPRSAASLLGLYIDGVTAEDRRRFFGATRTVKKEAIARRLRLVAEVNLVERLGEIQCPTLFVAGDRDLLIPSVREAKAMAARMSNASVRVIRGAGHACLLGGRVSLAELLND
jgi:pimeloyl-ACP methyl ester carboxylesterase